MASKAHVWREFERFRRDQFELDDAHFLTIKDCGASGWRVSVDFGHHDGNMDDLFVSTGMGLEDCIWECLEAAPNLTTFALNGTGWAPDPVEPREIKNQWRKAISNWNAYTVLEDQGLIEWVGGNQESGEGDK